MATTMTRPAEIEVYVGGARVPEVQHVLDHGYVKLIDYMGTDATIVEAARMSTGRGFVSWQNYTRCKTCPLIYGNRGHDIFVPGDKSCEHTSIEKFPRGDLGLLEYLFANGHTSPFEFCEVHFEVNAPILVWRQWERHRTQSYNEQSGRYGPLPDLYYLPTEERIAGALKANANKQAGGKGRVLSPEGITARRQGLAVEQDESRRIYELHLDIGMAPELARVNGLVSQYSKVRVKTDLHNWLGFLKLRAHSHAQEEIRLYAEAVAKVIDALYPLTWALFLEYTRDAVRLSASEVAALRVLMGHGKLPYAAASAADPAATRALKKLGVLP